MQGSVSAGVQALVAAARVLLRQRWLAPLFGVVLCLPAVGPWRVLDDHVLELAATGAGDVVPRASGIDLFEFASGDPQQNRQLMSRGALLPWWSDPELKIRFFRPLSSLSHRLDFWLWPGRSPLMYLHSLLWLGLLLLLVARLHARVEAAQPGVAALAALLYAAGHANAAVVSWLSNRNALIAACAALGCVLARQHSRDGAHPVQRCLSPLCLGLSLFAGELGLGAWAFLLADALVLDRRPLPRRLAALLPHVLVTGAWLLAYVASGAGTRGSGVYLHPLQEPAELLRALPLRAVLLLGAALGPLPAELPFLGPPGWLPLALGTAVLLLVGLLLAQARQGFDPALRFWWLSAGLGLLPIAAAFPSDRLLLLVNVAVAPVVARVLLQTYHAGATRHVAQRWLAGLLCLTHALLAPLSSPWRAHQMQVLGACQAHAFAVLDRIPDLEHQTLVVLGAPADFFVGYLQLERAARHAPRPEHVYWLANPGAALQVRTSGARSLSVQRSAGFFVSAPESLYRRHDAALPVGAELALPELSASIRGWSPAGAVDRIELTLSRPLAAPGHVFLVWRDNEYVRVGAAELAQLEIPAAPTLVELLARGAVPGP